MDRFSGPKSVAPYVPKTQPLYKQRFEKFYNLYSTPGTDCFNNGTKSYIAAGYKDGKSAKFCASNLLNSKKFAERCGNKPAIERKKLEIRGEYADQELIDALEECRDNGDMTNRVALIRLYQQRCGQLSDRLVLDLEDSRALDANYKDQARRIASIILSGELPQGDAQSIQPCFDVVSRETHTQDIVQSDNQERAITNTDADNDTQVIDNTGDMQS